MNILFIFLIIIASLSIVIGLGIIVDYMINAKLENFQNYLNYKVSCLLEELEEKYSDD